MATLGNRPNTALLVVDVQCGVVEGAHQRDPVVANVGSLVEMAQRERAGYCAQCVSATWTGAHGLTTKPQVSRPMRW
jgi:hypothetical protein